MQVKIFSVYDSKAEIFMQPFVMQTKGQAIRAFTDLVNDDKNQFSKHPEDYTLFELGSFDDNTGKVDSLKTPESMGLAMEFINSTH